MGPLGGRYAPITEALGFLEAEYSEVVAADASWRDSLGGYRGRTVSGNVPALLDGLLPLTGPLVRYIWVQTTERWTAYFDNFVNGSDPFGPVSYLAQRLSCRGVLVGHREATAERGESARFSLYGPERTDWLNLVRAVSAEQDQGRWKWSEAGAVQPFEDAAAYQRRRVRDRLTPDMLASYCGALGIRLNDETFYGTTGHLVECTAIVAPIRTETLEQARARHGLPVVFQKSNTTAEP